MTVQEAIYDIIERLQMNSDDRRQPERIIAQWLTAARNSIAPEYINTNGGEVPPSMIKRFDCQMVATSRKDCDGCIKDLYIDLPVTPLDLKDDDGVQVFRINGKPIAPFGSVGMTALLRATKFAAEGWHREGLKVYLTGAFPDQMKVNVLIVPSSVIDNGLSAPFPAPEGAIAQILEAAEQIGRRHLGIPEDKISDGD